MQKIKFFFPLTIVGGLIVGAAACGDNPLTIGDLDSGTSDAATAKDAGGTPDAAVAKDAGGTPDAAIAQDAGPGTDAGAAPNFAVGGVVSGLVGTGLVLDNNGDTVVVAGADNSFVFPKKLAKGAAYQVTAKSQPGSPTQTCFVTGGDGTVSADVTTIKVDCTTNNYGIEVNVVGLEGSGLVLQNNAADDVTVTAANPVAPVKASFVTKIDSGKGYDVTIKSQPATPGQLCTVSGGKGTVVAGTVSSITVTCNTSYTIGGTVTGLAGKDLTLENNAGDTLKLNANGTFAFATLGYKGDKYAITVKANPTAPWQTCVITAGTEAGTIASANVTTIAVTCTTNKYLVSGTITGLIGSGAILRNNGGDAIALAAGATKFSFATKVDSGSMSTVTVGTQPTTPWQTCAVTNGGPTTVAAADITNVTMACTTNKYTVSAQVLGTSGAVVLQNNAGDDLSFAADGTKPFATKLDSGAPYKVTIKSCSGGLTCGVVNGSGNIAGADVTVLVMRLQKSCKDIKTLAPNLPSGKYSIDIDGTGPAAPFDTYCDMATDGGGWTLMLNRITSGDDTGQPDLNADIGVYDAARNTNWQANIASFYANAASFVFASKFSAACAGCDIAGYDSAIKVPKPAAAFTTTCHATNVSVAYTKLVGNGAGGQGSGFWCDGAMAWGSCNGKPCHYGLESQNQTIDGSWGQNLVPDMHFPSIYSQYKNVITNGVRWCRSCSGALSLNNQSTCCDNRAVDDNSTWTVWVR